MQRSLLVLVLLGALAGSLRSQAVIATAPKGRDLVFGAQDPWRSSKSRIVWVLDNEHIQQFIGKKINGFRLRRANLQGKLDPHNRGVRIRISHSSLDAESIFVGTNLKDKNGEIGFAQVGTQIHNQGTGMNVQVFNSTKTVFPIQYTIHPAEDNNPHNPPPAWSVTIKFDTAFDKWDRKNGKSLVIDMEVDEDRTRSQWSFDVTPSGSFGWGGLTRVGEACAPGHQTLWNGAPTGDWKNAKQASDIVFERGLRNATGGGSVGGNFNISLTTWIGTWDHTNKRLSPLKSASQGWVFLGNPASQPAKLGGCDIWIQNILEARVLQTQSISKPDSSYGARFELTQSVPNDKSLAGLSLRLQFMAFNQATSRYGISPGFDFIIGAGTKNAKRTWVALAARADSQGKLPARVPTSDQIPVIGIF